MCSNEHNSHGSNYHVKEEEEDDNDDDDDKTLCPAHESEIRSSSSLVAGSHHRSNYNNNSGDAEHVPTKNYQSPLSSSSAVFFSNHNNMMMMTMGEPTCSLLSELHHSQAILHHQHQQQHQQQQPYHLATHLFGNDGNEDLVDHHDDSDDDGDEDNDENDGDSVSSNTEHGHYYQDELQQPSQNQQVPPQLSATATTTTATTATTTATSVKATSTITTASNKQLFKKDPNAPKQGNSAYIHFAGATQKKIRAMMRSKSISARTANICKVVADAWKNLAPEERAPWEAIAREDRARYQLEKALYTGPWRVAKHANKRRNDVMPSSVGTIATATATMTVATTAATSATATKERKPKSPFSYFAKEQRPLVKRNMPAAATNGEIMKTLSQLWKHTPGPVRQRYKAQGARDQRENALTVALKTDGSSVSHEAIVDRQQNGNSRESCSPSKRSYQDKTMQQPQQARAHHNTQHPKYIDHLQYHNAAAPTTIPCTHQRHYPQQQQPIHGLTSQGNNANTTTILVTDMGAPAPVDRYRLHSSHPTTTHQYSYVAYDNFAREDQQELLKTFFYPESLRDAIVRATKEYEELAQTKKSTRQRSAT